MERPLYSGHPWDRKVSLIERCPHFRGQNVHNTNVIQCGTSLIWTPLGQEKVFSFEGIIDLSENIITFKYFKSNNALL